MNPIHKKGPYSFFCLNSMNLLEFAATARTFEYYQQLFFKLIGLLYSISLSFSITKYGPFLWFNYLKSAEPFQGVSLFLKNKRMKANIWIQHLCKYNYLVKFFIAFIFQLGLTLCFYLKNAGGFTNSTRGILSAHPARAIWFPLRYGYFFSTVFV